MKRVFLALFFLAFLFPVIRADAVQVDSSGRPLLVPLDGSHKFMDKYSQLPEDSVNQLKHDAGSNWIVVASKASVLGEGCYSIVKECLDAVGEKSKAAKQPVSELFQWYCYQRGLYCSQNLLETYRTCLNGARCYSKLEDVGSDNFFENPYGTCFSAVKSSSGLTPSEQFNKAQEIGKSSQGYCRFDSVITGMNSYPTKIIDYKCLVHYSEPAIEDAKLCIKQSCDKNNVAILNDYNARTRLCSSEFPIKPGESSDQWAQRCIAGKNNICEKLEAYPTPYSLDVKHEGYLFPEVIVLDAQSDYLDVSNFYNIQGKEFKFLVFASAGGNTVQISVTPVLQDVNTKPLIIVLKALSQDELSEKKITSEQGYNLYSNQVVYYGEWNTIKDPAEPGEYDVIAKKDGNVISEKKITVIKKPFISRIKDNFLNFFNRLNPFGRKPAVSVVARPTVDQSLVAHSDADCKGRQPGYCIVPYNCKGNIESAGDGNPNLRKHVCYYIGS